MTGPGRATAEYAFPRVPTFIVLQVPPRADTQTEQSNECKTLTVEVDRVSGASGHLLRLEDQTSVGRGVATDGDVPLSGRRSCRRRGRLRIRDGGELQKRKCIARPNQLISARPFNLLDTGDSQQRRRAGERTS